MDVEKFEELMLGLKEKRGMFIPDADYSKLCAFIHGFMYAWRQATGVNYDEEFTNWLRHVQQVHFSLSWDAYILIEMAGNNQKKAEAKLFELMDKFFLDVKNR